MLLVIRNLQMKARDLSRICPKLASTRLMNRKLTNEYRDTQP